MPIEVEGLEQVTSRIQSLPDEAKKEVLGAVADYGVEVLKEEPPEKYVSRRAAYGVTFFTEKQRRWFFAALDAKEIQVPYHRTHHLSKSWSFENTGSQVTFTNAAPYAPFVVGFAFQSRQAAKVGWKKVTDIVSGKLSFKSSKFRDVVMTAYQAAIRKLKLG